MDINEMLAKEKREFFRNHGDYAVDGLAVIFMDGATTDTSARAMLIPPPKDPWERAKLILRYWELKADNAAADFAQFRGYLHGTGCCPGHIRTEDEKLEHLKKLKSAASAARAKLRKAREAAKAETPAWHVVKRREEAATARRKENFLRKVDQIRL